MSFETIGAPEAERLPAMAQLLEPATHSEQGLMI
jgi:hypothetical protein